MSETRIFTDYLWVFLGENLNVPSRVFLLYNGVHYDTVTKHLSPKDYVQTIFSTSDEIALAEAVSLAEQLHTVTSVPVCEKYPNNFLVWKLYQA